MAETLGRQARVRGSPFALVNGATAFDGVAVVLPPGAVLTSTIHILYVSTPSGAISMGLHFPVSGFVGGSIPKSVASLGVVVFFSSADFLSFLPFMPVSLFDEGGEGRPTLCLKLCCTHQWGCLFGGSPAAASIEFKHSHELCCTQTKVCALKACAQIHRDARRQGCGVYSRVRMSDVHTGVVGSEPQVNRVPLHMETVHHGSGYGKREC